MGNMAYFPAYFSYARTLAGLTDEQFGRVMRAAIEYTETGNVPELDALEMMGFAFLKEDIDRAKEHYDAVCERRREAINKRWGNTGDTNEYKSIDLNTNDSKEKAIEKEKAKEKAIAKESIYNASDDAKPARTKRKAFSPPTLEDVKAYCIEQGYNTIDPAAFIDYYEANGWKVGSQSMKDWKATVRNWARRDKERGVMPKDKGSFDTDEFFSAAVAASQKKMEEREKKQRQTSTETPASGKYADLWAKIM